MSPTRYFNSNNKYYESAVTISRPEKEVRRVSGSSIGSSSLFQNPEPANQPGTDLSAKNKSKLCLLVAFPNLEGHLL